MSRRQDSDSVAALPQDPEAEMALLGACILDGDILSATTAAVEPRDFFQPAHMAIYQALLDMMIAGARVDLVLLNGTLRDKGTLDAVGGVDYLVRLAEAVPNAAGWTHYARRVRDKAQIRRLLESLDAGIRTINDNHTPAADLIEQIRASIDAAAQDVPAKRQEQLAMTDASTVTRTAIEWLWPGRVPIGKLTLLSGDPKLGKSLVTLDMAARVSTGCGFPDNPGAVPNEPASVLLISAEDDPSDTICPRLDAAHADSSRIKISTTVSTADPKPIVRSFSLADVAQLGTALESNPDIRLVIIDPVSAFMGHADSHVNAEVRAVLKPIAELAGKHRVAIVAVQHLNKASGGPALYRSMGSIGFVAAARSILAVVKDKDNPQRRLFLTVGGNLAPESDGLSYTVQATPEQVPYLVWDSSPIQTTADEAMSDSAGRPPDERRGAEQWLRDALQAGPRPMKALLDDWINGHSGSKRTLDRAKGAIGAQSYRPDPTGPWLWRMPT